MHTHQQGILHKATLKAEGTHLHKVVMDTLHKEGTLLLNMPLNMLSPHLNNNKVVLVAWKDGNFSLSRI